jgi:hypothetical protein
MIYGGRATITSLLNSGLALVWHEVVDWWMSWFQPEAQLVGVTPGPGLVAWSSTNDCFVSWQEGIFFLRFGSTVLFRLGDVPVSS